MRVARASLTLFSFIIVKEKLATSSLQDETLVTNLKPPFNPSYKMTEKDLIIIIVIAWL